MAYADATTNGRIILDHEGEMDVSLSEAVECGDLIGPSAGTWKLADAAGASSVNVFPELIASKKAASGDIIVAYRSAVIGGVTGGTKGSTLFLADAAGETLETVGTMPYVVGFVLTATTIFLCPQDINNVLGTKLNRTLAETVSANKTLALADCGVLQLVDTDSITVTLPATVVGYSYTIMNYAADGAAIVKIAPNASDLIAGGNATATDADTWNNTKATAKRGDFISIVGDGVNGWMITEMKGIWAVIAI